MFIEMILEVCCRITHACHQFFEEGHIFGDCGGILPQDMELFFGINSFINHLKSSLELLTKSFPSTIVRNTLIYKLFHRRGSPDCGIILKVGKCSMNPFHVAATNCITLLVDYIQGSTLGHCPHGESSEESTSVAALFTFERRRLLDSLRLGEVSGKLHGGHIGKSGYGLGQLSHCVWSGIKGIRDQTTPRVLLLIHSKMLGTFKGRVE